MDVSNLNEDFAKTVPRYPLLPATLLGRLAVDQSRQGKGIGELVLIDVMLLKGFLMLPRRLHR